MNITEVPRIPARNILRSWGYYERDHDKITGYDLAHAKRLFPALARLPTNSLTLLAEKYHTGILAGYAGDPGHPERHGVYRLDKPISDTQLASLHGITSAQYRAQRLAAEAELETIINEQEASTHA